MQKSKLILAMGARFNDFSQVQFDSYTAELVARFEENLQMVNAVTLGTKDGEIKAKGDTVKVQMPVDLGDADDMPNGGSSTPTEVEAQAEDVVLNQHKYKEFTTSDLEIATSLAGNIAADAGVAAIESIAKSIKKALIAEAVKNTYTIAGTAKNNAYTKADIINVRKIQNLASVPESNRYLALHSDTSADLLDVLSNSTAQTNVDSWNGQIGNKFQYDIFEDTAIGYQVSGGAASTYAVNGAASAGATQLNVDGGSNGFAVGDIISFAGSSQTHVVQSALVGAGTLHFLPALKTNIADNAVVTCQASHPLNFAFHKSAFAIATRKMQAPSVTSGAMITEISTPNLGIPLRFVKWYNPATEKTHVKVSVLFGVKAVDPSRCARMLNK